MDGRAKPGHDEVMSREQMVSGGLMLSYNIELRRNAPTRKRAAAGSGGLSAHPVCC